MRSPVYCLSLVAVGSLLALPAIGAAPEVYMVEAPFRAPNDVVISVARLEPQRTRSPVKSLHPRTTWGVFSEGVSRSVGTNEHGHTHDSDGPCPACESFEQSRRQMMARAFDDLIAQLDEDEASDESGDEPSFADDDEDDRENDDEGLSDLDDDAPRKRKSSLWDAPPITIQPLSSVDLRTDPDLTKSQQLPPNLASRRYSDYQSAASFGSGQSKGWSPKTYQWHAPSFYHRPLYFEQVNLERYGHYHQNWKLESVLSAAHFFGSAVKLPLQLGAYHPCERVYTLGRYRPGNCNPNHRYLIPITWDGILKQGLAQGALLWALL